ncbi:MAG: FAD-binding protein, partial [Prochloraceae cyanobacterium]|nr:FAD-binding protein [Prochloraceae cyanobacterium]
PKQARGGNSYFTDGAIRFAYKNLDQIREILPELTETRAAQCDLGSYTEENYLETLISLSQGKIDRDLARTLVSSSYQTIQWMHQQGVKFALLDRNQAFKSKGRYHFWGGLVVKAVGRGVGSIESLFARAVDLGIEVWYETRAIGLIKNTQGQISGIKIKRGQKTLTLETAAVILASGGFELPWDGEISSGKRLLRGRSWSGVDKISKVEVSLDNGRNWQLARLRQPNLSQAWVRWDLEWNARPGHYQLLARATDSQGNRQPDLVPFNQKGYLY